MVTLRRSTRGSGRAATRTAAVAAKKKITPSKPRDFRTTQKPTPKSKAKVPTKAAPPKSRVKPTRKSTAAASAAKKKKPAGKRTRKDEAEAEEESSEGDEEVEESEKEEEAEPTPPRRRSRAEAASKPSRSAPKQATVVQTAAKKKKKAVEPPAEEAKATAKPKKAITQKESKVKKALSKAEAKAKKALSKASSPAAIATMKQKALSKASSPAAITTTKQTTAPAAPISVPSKKHKAEVAEATRTPDAKKEQGGKDKEQQQHQQHPHCSSCTCFVKKRGRGRPRKDEQQPPKVLTPQQQQQVIYGVPGVVPAGAKKRGRPTKQAAAAEAARKELEKAKAAAEAATKAAALRAAGYKPQEAGQVNVSAGGQAFLPIAPRAGAGGGGGGAIPPNGAAVAAGMYPYGMPRGPYGYGYPPNFMPPGASGRGGYLPPPGYNPWLAAPPGARPPQFPPGAAAPVAATTPGTARAPQSGFAGATPKGQGQQQHHPQASSVLPIQPRATPGVAAAGGGSGSGVDAKMAQALKKPLTQSASKTPSASTGDAAVDSANKLLSSSSGRRKNCKVPGCPNPLKCTGGYNQKNCLRYRTTGTEEVAKRKEEEFKKMVEASSAKKNGADANKFAGTATKRKYLV